jgi:signal peptidase I
MARRTDPDDDPAEDDDVEPERGRRRPLRRPAPRRSERPRPVRRWNGPDDEEDEVDVAPPPRRRFLRRESHPVYWRARDSLYFEPLVAVAIIVVLLAGLYAYTQNWPPIYVVESDSMQHGSTDVLGVINTGDLVLAQRVPASRITPYVVGVATGYSTYGEYGDVLLYLPNGQGSTPVIHRAILFLGYNPARQAYNATDLAGLPCGTGPHDAYDVTDCNATLTNLTGTLTLYRIGWHAVNVSLDLSPTALGAHSGYVTMGDNNFGCVSGGGCTGRPDQSSGLSELVEPGWIIGVARGMLPWFGAIKLAVEGNSNLGEVPPQSWQFLALTVVGVILLAFGIHYALRAEGIEDPRRKDEEAAEDEDDEPPPGRARRFLRGLKPWGRSDADDDDGEDEDGAPRSRGPRASAPVGAGGRRGRPVPRVRRKKPKRKSEGDDDL